MGPTSAPAGRCSDIGLLPEYYSQQDIDYQVKTIGHVISVNRLTLQNSNNDLTLRLETRL
jgi:hypothetical protein